MKNLTKTLLHKIVCVLLTIIFLFETNSSKGVKFRINIGDQKYFLDFKSTF